MNQAWADVEPEWSRRGRHRGQDPRGGKDLGRFERLYGQGLAHPEQEEQ